MFFFLIFQIFFIVLHFSPVWPQPCQQSYFRACASQRSMLLVRDALSSFNLEHVLFFLVCLFLRLSGFMLPSPIVSSGSILALWFTTDFAVSAQGFKAVYEGKAARVMTEGCRRWLTVSTSKEQRLKRAGKIENKTKQQKISLIVTVNEKQLSVWDLALEWMLFDFKGWKHWSSFFFFFFGKMFIFSFYFALVSLNHSVHLWSRTHMVFICA